jgi:glycosyltransferase involved in cell wall biosynthesis
MSTLRILFVAPYIPSPIRVRPYQWIRALAKQGHAVRLVTLQPPEDAWLTEVPVRDCCEAVHVFPLSRTRTLLNALSAVPRNLPLQAAYSLHREFEEFVGLQARNCDVVHVEHLRGSLLARRIHDIPRVIDAVDSITALFEQTRHQASSWQHRLMARADLERTRRFEAALSTRFERIIVSSRRDATAFQRLGSNHQPPTVTLPNGVDLEYFQPTDRVPDPATVLFTGKMSYHANEAAAIRLVRDIMPRVWQTRPDAKVVLAGKDPSETVRALAADGRVTVTGFVDDLRPYFASATVVAAPLPYGTGIQNKILEAMACGAPVVASQKACEGIDAAEGQDLLVGQTDDEISGHLTELLRYRHLRGRLALNGRRYVAAHHNWVDLGRQLVAVYDDAQRTARLCA